MKRLIYTLRYLMALMLIFVTWIGQPQASVAAASYYLTTEPTTFGGVRGCWITINNGVSFFMPFVECTHHVYEITHWQNTSNYPIAPKIVVNKDGLVTEFADKALQVPTAIWMEGQTSPWVLTPSNELAEWAASMQAVKLLFPPTIQCRPMPCPFPLPWPNPYPPFPWPDPYPPTFPWPFPWLLKTITLGEHHNAALDYFHKNETSLIVREDNNISLTEYERLLRATTNYTIENVAPSTLDVDVARDLKTLETMGLIVQANGDAYVVTGFQEVASKQIAYLLKQGEISQQLADELTKINIMAQNATDGEQVREYVENSFLNQEWDDRDAVSVAIYEDIFSNSATYWKTSVSNENAKPKWWVIPVSDALGGLVGFFGDGGVKGAIGLGSAFSVAAASEYIMNPIATETPTATGTQTNMPTSTPTATITATVTKRNTPTATHTPTPIHMLTNTATSTATTIITVKILASITLQDGCILESSKTSDIGGSLNSNGTTLTLGDDTSKRQYRCILSFNTSSVPDNAVITGVTLKVKKQASLGGGDPALILKGLMSDIKKGFFSTTPLLQTNDFQAPANGSYWWPLPAVSADNWYNINLMSGQAYINKLSSNAGLTQIRLRFKLDDNDNAIANILKLYSGNSPYPPQLVITYSLP